MNLTFLIPLGLGIVSVLQAGLNRRVASGATIQIATLTNCIVLLAVSIIFYLLSPTPPTSLSGVLRAKGILVLIPGVLGLFLVAGIPWSIGKWGASFVFVWIIGSQMASGILWDALFEAKSIHPMQFLGASLSIIGALCFSL